MMASIMEVLAESTVVEIVKAIDEGTAVLRLEMSQSKKENETLKWRLLEMEKELLEVRRGGGNRATSRDTIHSVKVQVGKEIRGPDSNSYGSLEPERDSTERQYGEESDPQPASTEVTEEADTRPAAAGGRLEQHTLSITMEGTAESHTPPAPPESTAGSEDACRYFLCGENTKTAKRAARKLLACTHCGKNFSHFSTFQKHKLSCSSRNGKHFCHKSELAHCKSAEIEQKPFRNSQFSCEHCTKTFSCSYDLETHRAIHKEKPFRCNDCGKCYLEKWHLNSHLCSRSGEEPYKCIDCGNGFSQEVKLSLHQCSHTRDRPSSCAKSGDSSQKCEFELQQHIFQEGNFYSCAACQKSFTKMNIFNQHLCNRTGEKLHRCLMCGKCFSQSSNLNLHQRTVHTGEKPYSCAECGKNFSQKASLQRHQVIHSGEKSYSCAECGKNFSQKGSLQRHQIIHTGVKPYKCLECGKSFTEKGSLKKHHRIHRGVKPYRCRECGKCFSRKGHLNSHERNHRREATLVL